MTIGFDALSLLLTKTNDLIIPFELLALNFEPVIDDLNGINDPNG